MATVYLPARKKSYFSIAPKRSNKPKARRNVKFEIHRTLKGRFSKSKRSALVTTFPKKANPHKAKRRNAPLHGAALIAHTKKIHGLKGVVKKGSHAKNKPSRISYKRKNKSKRRSNTGLARTQKGRFKKMSNSPKHKTKYRTNTVVVYKVRGRRNNPYHAGEGDSLMKLGTWGKVGIGILIGLTGLAVAFAIPRGLAILTKKDFFQRGLVGVGVSATVVVGTAVVLHVLGQKRSAIAVLVAGGVGVVLLLGYALVPKVMEVAIPVQEALIAAHLPTTPAADPREADALAASKREGIPLAAARARIGLTGDYGTYRRKPVVQGQKGFYPDDESTYDSYSSSSSRHQERFS